ncbi:5-(carboxyamino)imidazole ribonucleotide synthase [Occallatibacter riparius]|uniref:N5-carboxyaminoimidazole ribonucleotide synthase n=1 Tax=Occallatibacter riparius TaxID=1002689 RepID=A0A9J7BTQ9_9BACT|nr:5-(carboxyamino)imidazole ribonucleotide synthase [Occallatibacter riparius]UWZ86032.1 5-(carboxyamino)imidazole ribonucleotide synthase [Occallatibacter riparius]
MTPETDAKQVQPGGTLAILGGGQLGRMMAMAARTMGYHVRVMDPEQRCPASFVVDQTIVGKWDDAEAAHRLADGADAVTLEIEQIGIDALQRVADIAPLRPGVEPIRIIQDKTLQKPWLAEHGFPVGPFHVVRSEEELQAAVPALENRVFLKIGRGGYDGRGQVRIGLDQPVTPSEIEQAWNALGGNACVAEQALDLDIEISVMAARNPAGEVRSFPAARNHHENQILAWSVLPAGISPELEERAERLAREISTGLGVEGMLCVEMFVTKQGELFVNELAPRPHNSYHQSERGCATSQFEQAVRAALNLPLGDTSLISPCAIVNLLGDVWLDGEPDFAAAMEVPSVGVHLYEKLSARPGRKMGHLSSVGSTAEEALDRVLEAKRRLHS